LRLNLIEREREREGRERREGGERREGRGGRERFQVIIRISCCPHSNPCQVYMYTLRAINWLATPSLSKSKL
jgi:hypothetical protein